MDPSFLEIPKGLKRPLETLTIHSYVLKNQDRQDRVTAVSLNKVALHYDWTIVECYIGLP